MSSPESPAVAAARAGYDRTGRVFILVCLAASLYLGYLVFRSFLKAIAIAAVLNVTFHPLFLRLERRFGGRRAAAAGVTVLIVVIAVILPLMALGVLFTKEALDLYEYLSARAQDGSLGEMLPLHSFGDAEALIGKYAPWINLERLNLKDNFIALLRRVSTYSVSLGTTFATNVLVTLATFAVVLFSLFFFLLDGRRVGAWASGLVPLSAEHQEKLVGTFTSITRSAVHGSGLVALVQGFLGGLAFWIVGLHGVLWGSVMMFMSLVPVVGTALIWAPAALILLVQGRPGAAVFLVLWGVLAISSVDNIIRMFVVRAQVRLHPLLIFFSVMGGLRLAGLLGVVFGPLILAVILTLLEIYRGEFMPAPPPPPKEETPT